MVNRIRKAAVAGTFYPAEKETLDQKIAIYLENSRPVEIVSQVFGLIVPHAGYIYSGGVAARAYRQIVDRDFDVVVVISPSHRIYFEEVSVYDGDGYETPLGTLAVDKEKAQRLAAMSPNIILSDLGHEIDEHALEVQLPFLQHILYDFKLLPIVMGNQDAANVEALADALTELLKDCNALIVASSDLSHFHNYDKATLLDKVVVEDINQFDDIKLAEDLANNACEMCGGGPVLATMKACRSLGANKAKVLLYRNSGDVSGDKEQVVGYLAGMLYS